MTEAKTHVDRLVNFYESMTDASVRNMQQFYSEDATFRDPFNDVQGIEAIRKIFLHMFEKLHEPRFVVTQRIEQGNDVVLIWDFTFRLKSYKPDVTQSIHGLSHIRFAEDGRVAYHVDYWDAAKELYEKLPLIGGIMRWLRGRMG